MIVPIDASTRQTAEAWSRKIFATGLTRRPNYSGMEKPERFIYGYIGELCFKRGLWSHGKRFVYDPTPNGKSDLSGRDFIVWRHDGRLTINVKTAGEAFHRHMMIPECMFVRYKADVYVAAHLVDDDCHFRGWLYHHEVATIQPTQVLVPTRKVLFDHLRGIEGLLTMLQNQSEQSTFLDRFCCQNFEVRERRDAEFF